MQDVTSIDGEPHASDGWLVLAFESPQVFEAWLEEHHATQPGLWLKFAKKGSGLKSVTLPEAKEVAMCYGWVDSIMHRYDAHHYILRYQPRRSKSRWSPGNCRIAERLVAEGRMRPAGAAHMAAARADGRWQPAD